jgi:hypothetical protein
VGVNLAFLDAKPRRGNFRREFDAPASEVPPCRRALQLVNGHMLIRLLQRDTRCRSGRLPDGAGGSRPTDERDGLPSPVGHRTSVEGLGKVRSDTPQPARFRADGQARPWTWASTRSTPTTSAATRPTGSTSSAGTSCPSSTRDQSVDALAGQSRPLPNGGSQRILGLLAALGRPGARTAHAQRFSRC